MKGSSERLGMGETSDIKMVAGMLANYSKFSASKKSPDCHHLEREDDRIQIRRRGREKVGLDLWQNAPEKTAGHNHT